MKLILRMAYNRSDPQRAEEARQLLRTTPSSDDMVRARSEEVIQTCHSSTPKSRSAIRSATSNSELPNGGSMESG